MKHAFKIYLKNQLTLNKHVFHLKQQLESNEKNGASISSDWNWNEKGQFLIALDREETNL